MSKEALLHNWQQQSVAVASELRSKQCVLESIKNVEEINKQLADTKRQQGALESRLSAAQSDCRESQVGYQQATSALGRLSIENKTLNDELQAQKKLFAFLANLSDKYRKFEGIAANPAVVMTKKISAEELAHTDLLKVTCKEKCRDAFDLALSKITDVNIQDLDGRTILMHAVINGFYYAVDKLLQKGADVNILDKQGANALFYCTLVPHIKYFKQIAEKTIDLNYRFPTFRNGCLLHSLIENSGNIIFASELNRELKDSDQTHYIFKLLVMDGESYTLRSLGGERKSDGYTINNEKTLYIIKYLIGKGVDINAQNDQGVTPFFLACACKLKYLSKQLINHWPIDWGLIDNFGYNALHWVLKLRDKDLVRQVIDKGIDINHQDQNGNTALVWAAIDTLPDIVDLLFNVYNARDLANNNGITAWDIATLNIQPGLIEVLITKKGIKKEFVELWCAAKKKIGDLSLVEQLLNNNIDPNLTIDNYNNTTPLIQAVVCKHVQIIESLLQHGADINKADKKAASPLYYSLGYGGQTVDPTIVRLLLTKGANVNQAMLDGDTPLHMASYQANVSAMKILLNNGAIINTKNDQGKTPLDVLIEKQGLEQERKLAAVKYLLMHSTFPLANDTVHLAKNYFADAVPWLEHPENLPTIVEFEASIIGSFPDLLI